MRPTEILDGNLGLVRGVGCYMPYGYILNSYDIANATPYQVLIDTGSSIILVVMDLAEDLLNLSREDVIANRLHEQEIGGIGGRQIGYAWRADLRLKSATANTGAMQIKNALIHAVDCDAILGYSAVFGQKTGLEQRWFKQHNHSAKRYWQLREWK